MQIPAGTKYALYGAVGGAALVLVLGFTVGGWVTGSTAEEMAEARAETAIIAALTPYCVEMAQSQPAQMELLLEESSWSRDSFGEKAGWVSNVDEKYRDAVAISCASQAAEAAEAKAAKPG